MKRLAVGRQLGLTSAGDEAYSIVTCRAARGDLIYNTGKYFFISQSVSWTRYSSHSFRFSST
jgi:hypothetical protein